MITFNEILKRLQSLIIKRILFLILLAFILLLSLNPKAFTPYGKKTPWKEISKIIINEMYSIDRPAIILVSPGTYTDCLKYYLREPESTVINGGNLKDIMNLINKWNKKGYNFYWVHYHPYFNNIREKLVHLPNFKIIVTYSQKITLLKDGILNKPSDLRMALISAYRFSTEYSWANTSSESHLLEEEKIFLEYWLTNEIIS